jgi:transposase
MSQDRYSLEFKLEAVRLSRQPGIKAAEVARDLGISTSSIYRWRKEYPDEGGGEGNLASAERAELERLRQENAKLKQERDILKKATRIFAAMEQERA